MSDKRGGGFSSLAGDLRQYRGVGVGRYLNRRVSEHGGDHFHFGSGGERQGGCQMPQVLQTDRRQIPYRHKTEVLRRLLEPKQYVSIRYTGRLADIGASASVGSVADSYDCQSLRTGSRKDRVVPAVSV
nr:hypothetical protein OG999_33945 [Streptomyces sp. NBC_00886]